MKPEKQVDGKRLDPLRKRTVTIVKESKSNVVLVIPSEPSESEDVRAVAEELKKYLNKVSEADLPIKHENEIIEKHPFLTKIKIIPIYIGKCKASHHLKTHLRGMTNDGYVIDINKDSIHVLGKNDLSTQFGVYSFLEDYIGVHWFLPEVFGDSFPDNMGTHIPDKQTIVLRTTLDVQEASFKYRYIGGPGNPWSMPNKMNTFLKHLDANQNFYQINRPCHSFITNFIDPHMEEHFSHPEYFAIVDGYRMTSSELENDSHDPAIEDRLKRIKLNVGNPELRDRFVEQVQTYILDNPIIGIINLFPSDGKGFDESEESIAMDGENFEGYTVVDVNNRGRSLGDEYGRVLSKRYTIFYHDVLSDLVSRHDKIFMTGAYSAYQYAPLEVDDPDFVSRYRMDNEVILLITHSWEHNHPIGERNTPPNDYFAESINGWSHLYSSFGVYEYYYKLAMCELPFPIIHSIRHDIPYYHNNNFEFFYTQYTTGNIGTYGLNHYIAAKLLWDVNADVDELLDEFYSKFYGPAGDHMREYYETLENAAIESNLKLSPKYYGAFLDLFSDQVLRECRGHLIKAEEAVIDDELFLARVELSKISLCYTRKVVNYLKEIKDEMANRFFWEMVHWRDNLDLALATCKAEEIREVIDQFSRYKTIRETNYTKGLLTVGGGTIKGVRAYFYSDSDQYTKEKWVEMGDAEVVPGYGGHILFDIWIYGHDIDIREHQINVINNDGSRTELGTIAGGDNETGNNRERGFLLQNFPFEDYIGDDEEMAIEAFHLGGRLGSRFYAFAIMPHNGVTTQDDVTWYYQNDINYIRRHSIGFTEYKERMQNRPGERLNTTIKLYHE